MTEILQNKFTQTAFRIRMQRETLNNSNTTIYKSTLTLAQPYTSVVFSYKHPTTHTSIVYLTAQELRACAWKSITQSRVTICPSSGCNVDHESPDVRTSLLFVGTEERVEESSINQCWGDRKPGYSQSLLEVYHIYIYITKSIHKCINYTSGTVSFSLLLKLRMNIPT